MIGRPAIVAACIVFALALLHPPHGIGVNICFWRNLTDMPCPGCGLTRSVSSAARGHLADSVMYHPFGVVLLALCMTTSSAAVAPRRLRRRLMRVMLRRAALVHATYVVVVGGFAAFGVLRVILSVS